jgi:hypothetical protein
MTYILLLYNLLLTDNYHSTLSEFIIVFKSIKPSVIHTINH